jgi:hypothetical protein
MTDEIILNGRNYILKPNFEALKHIEQELESGLTALARKLVDGMLTLEETAAIIAHCIEGDIERAAIGEALVQGGFARATHVIAEMFSQTLSYHHSLEVNGQK